MSAAALRSAPDPGLPASEEVAGAEHARGLPREAREGLMRAWLALLRERHPELSWVPAERVEQEQARAEDAPGAPAEPALLPE